MERSTKTQSTLVDTSPQGVRLYAPSQTAKKGYFYWRVVWREADGTRKEKTFQHIKKKEADTFFAEVSFRLKSGTGNKSLRSIEVFMNAYLDPESRGVKHAKWSRTYRLNLPSTFRAHIWPALKDMTKPCGSLTETDLLRLVEERTSWATAERFESRSLYTRTRIAAALSAWIHWGYQEGWILMPPSHIVGGLKTAATYIKEAGRIPMGSSDSNPTGNPTDSKQTPTRNVVKYVEPEQIPSHDAVAAVAKEAAKISGIWWYELLWNLAAYSGLRTSELFDLDPSKIDLVKRRILVNSQILFTSNVVGREIPKWGSIRTSIYVKVTPCGYPLAKELERRIQELNVVSVVPKLQDGTQRLLLFPNLRGGYQRHGNLGRGVRRKAQASAGWPQKNGRFVWNFHSLRHVFCTYLIVDLKQPIITVSQLAGHKSTKTTERMYVHVGENAIAALQASIDEIIGDGEPIEEEKT
jgi:integrase